MEISELIREIKARKDLEEVVHHEDIPPAEARYGETKAPLSDETVRALRGLGIDRLYSHQAKGIDLVREGKNVVVMTPTASGKSLIYNIPVLESLLEDRDSKALYIYPLKGLEQDQLGALKELTGLMGLGAVEAVRPKRTVYAPGVAEIYDGDTTGYRRKRIRESPPAVLLTNPDMLHMAILAFHQKWEAFMRNLNYVVIDEVHSYRGVFGSHVANVLRRLRRIAGLYGSFPRFISCSATIANPGELAAALTGEDHEVVGFNGAPRGRRHFLFINPPPAVSPYTVATRLFTLSVKAGLKTIAFTKARKITELIYRWVLEANPELVNRISSYRAGFLPEERRDIENRLFGGDLTGVISTSALELGVDIGGLDVCILVGYPGTIASTWQRSGRAGRSGRDSLIAMIAQRDALDQHFMRNPGDFFGRSVEAAVLDGENPSILKPHLLSAISEAYLKSDDAYYAPERYLPVLEELENEGKIRHWAKGDIWYPRRKTPQREISIREAGEPYSIVDGSGKLLGESSSTRVLSELHPGAIYLHRGMQWRVVRLDMGGREVVCLPAEGALYYTRPITEEDTRIIAVDGVRDFKRYSVNIGRLRVTERVVGYRKKHIHTDRVMGEYTLDLPASVFTTVGIWMKVDERIIKDAEKSGWSPAGGLHALEHSAIAALPLYALCDRSDLGGVSYVFNPELASPAIFIYDGHEGGVGLTKRGFDCLPEWFASTRRLMEECPCEVACPSCTQDPRCGNNNEPLDKRAALGILKAWAG